MSIITEILDRLTGIAVLKAQLDSTAGEVRRMGDWMLDLERRLIRVESSSTLSATPAPAPKRKRLTKKS